MPKNAFGKLLITPKDFVANFVGRLFRARNRKSDKVRRQSLSTKCEDMWDWRGLGKVVGPPTESPHLLNRGNFRTVCRMEEALNQMRRTVRHKLTGLFYQQSGDLTPYEDQAVNFPTIEAAIRFCQEHGLLDVDLVVKSAPAAKPEGLICTMRI